MNVVITVTILFRTFHGKVSLWLWETQGCFSHTMWPA